jgi:fructose-bisphosphate aldolase class I
LNTDQLQQVANSQGFIAALDQSGGSTPKALRDYGVETEANASQDELFDLIHVMRTRIITSASFDGTRVFGAILFQETMNRQIDGLGSAEYLWEKKQIVPFLKVDQGLAEQAQGVQLMKPLDDLPALLDEAKTHPVFGTKMRSVIHLADAAGVDGVLDQQFEVARQILAAGLMPIVEPEVDIKSPEKAEAESLLKAGLEKHLAQLEPGQQVMLKLSLPSTNGFYSSLAELPQVLRVVALSGGYDRAQACELLAQNPGMTASFSRALAEGLNVGQSDGDFNSTLDHTIAEIYAASSTKTV